MNVNPLIISALSTFSMPVCPDILKTDDPLYAPGCDYITFNYADERHALNADDTDILDETTVQVHYFTKGNPIANKKAIRKALRSAGFLIQSTSQLYENDTGYYHVVIYAAIEGFIDD